MKKQYLLEYQLTQQLRRLEERMNDADKWFEVNVPRLKGNVLKDGTWDKEALNAGDRKLADIIDQASILFNRICAMKGA